MQFDVGFSFRWFNLEVVWYSLEQNICWSIWQAFIYCCRLHQTSPDLMKSTVVDESLSNTSTNVLFQRIPNNFKIRSAQGQEKETMNFDPEKLLCRYTSWDISRLVSVHILITGHMLLTIHKGGCSVMNNILNTSIINNYPHTHAIYIYVYIYMCVCVCVLDIPISMHTQ